jgi:hypothetical protein
MVEIELWNGPSPPMRAFVLPEIATSSATA